MSASPLQRGASKGVPQGGILQRRSTSVSMMQQQSHVSRVEPGYHTRSVYHVTKGTNAVLVGNRTISIHGEAHCSCTRTHTPTYKCTPAQLSLTHTHTHAHTRLHTQPSHTHTHTQRMRTYEYCIACYIHKHRLVERLFSEGEVLCKARKFEEAEDKWKQVLQVLLRVLQT